MDLDGVTIACPRCAKPMDTFTKRGGSAEVAADMCLECGGVWLDGAEVRRLYPEVALAARAATSSAVKPILACPRCGDLPSVFRFFELELDVCGACKGVWIDGDELSDLARTADRIEGRDAPEASSYRDNAADALLSGRTTCTGCDGTFELDAVTPTSKGPLCGTCVEAYRERLFEKELAAYEVPKKSLLELPSLEELGRGLRAAASLLSTVLTETSARCATCGCRGQSRCGH